MTLPVSGPISLNAVNVELGLSGTTLISLNQASVRTLAGVPSGVISMSNLYGKSNRVTVVYNITSNVLGSFAINVNSVSGYIAGLTDIIVNVSAGVYVAAPGTSSIPIYFTSGNVGDTVTINNSGYILGAGGAGGIGRNSSPGTGGHGQSAIAFLFSPVSLTVNNAAGAYICGGGGGGGGGLYGGGGGGAGGGVGGDSFTGSFFYNGGAGGAIGAAGANGGGDNSDWNAGGGGGRIIPGTTAYNSGSRIGVGGSAGGQGGGYFTAPGGPGGGGNTVGAPALTFSLNAGAGGGGWGAAGGSATAAGGNAGNAILRPTGAYVLNNSGVIYGPIV